MSNLPSQLPEEAEAVLPEEAEASQMIPVAGSLREVGRRVFSSLRYRNYRLFFTGQFISTMGTWIQQPVMQWLVWEMTKSEFMLGVLTAVGAIPVTVLSPLGGLAAERFEKRRLLSITQPLLFIAPVVLAVAMLINYQMIQVWHLFAVALFTGTIMAFDVPARQTLVVDLVDRPDVPNAIALNSFVFNLSRMIGPIVGVALMTYVSPAACFGANGFSYIALIVALAMMPLPPRPTLAGVAARNQRVHHPWGGFLYAWNQRDIRMTLLLLAATTVFGWSIMSQLPAFTEKVFQQERKAFGVFLTVFGAGALVGALAMAYLSGYKNRRHLILAGLGIFIVSISAFVWSRAVWSPWVSVDHVYYLALVPMFFAGLGLLMSMSGINSHIQMEVSHRFHGRVMGVYAMFFGGMMPLGTIATGYLAETYRLVEVVQANIVALALFTTYAAFYWPRLRRG